MLDTYGRNYFDKYIDKIANFLLKRKLTPSMITIIALILGLFAAITFYLEFWVLAIVCLWVSGLLDAVDGSMARISKKTSSLGTLMDICFDRVVEIGMLVAISLRFPDSIFALFFAVCSIVLSMTVFLTSGMLLPNNSKKTFKYQAGIMERTEGFIFFTAMMIFSQYIKIIIITYAILILYTAVQRFISAVKILKD